MCGICGCTEGGEDMHHTHDEKTHHHHDHDNLIHIEQDILANNNHYAKQNQAFFEKRKILGLNLMSSPGSGKTTLLAKTMTALQGKMDFAVIVGDQETDYDAMALQASGAPAIQVNTGKVCHLDAHSVGHAIEKLPITERMVLFIENIGNLVCPALFNLGEKFKIVILSVAEGDNKPLKYPQMFRCADLLILTKSDLLPYVDFDIEKCIGYARKINPGIEVLTVSSTKDLGLKSWYEWLLQKQQCV